MNEMNTGNRGWSRRGFLQGSAAAMAAAYGLRPADTLAEIPIVFDGSKFQLAAPEPNPKRGGVLRVGILNRLPHFDFQQSGTVGNIGAQGCMFDNLIRHDPRDSGKTIIPDLAHSWEIAKDGKTYTFFLRKGVQFHDGAELTADDVKATFDRIARPPAGRQHPAQHPVQGGQRDHRARQVHRAVQAVRAATGQLHHGGDRQRLERHRAQADAGGEQLQSAQGVEHSRHRPVQDRRAASRTKSG